MSGFINIQQSDKVFIEQIKQMLRERRLDRTVLHSFEDVLLHVDITQVLKVCQLNVYLPFYHAPAVL